MGKSAYVENGWSEKYSSGSINTAMGNIYLKI